MQEQQKWIARWHEQGALSAQQIPAALRLAGVPPSGQEWRAWIDRLLLWLGVAALLAGLIFFVAANWSGMGRFGKFALAEAAIIASLVAYALSARFRYGNAALLAASLAVGALLALIGQTYQTGADTFELFAVWALLILPWVLMARLPALWVLWLAILNVAYVFYVQTFGARWGLFLHDEKMFVGIALFDSCALIVWEWFAARGREWMRGRWVPRLLALTAGGVATVLAIYFIVNYRYTNGWYFVLYIAVIVGMYGGYRYWVPDLFMLAGGALSVIVVATTGLGRILFENNTRELISAFLLLGLFSMLTTAGAAWWLRQVAYELKGKPPTKKQR
ncbi:MAG: DUF2157 domain-containing protein [Zoogloeaceae bacterium]|jgi:uncharacterized membrane protein|nr:DUF2157 domain-containing protein [Zoogloeaceae bacterium]